LLAAHRGGISTVVIPLENEKDLVEIPKNIKDKLNIVPVRWIDEVLQVSLQNMPSPKAGKAGIAKDESQSKSSESTGKGVRPH
jgi:ATP-dependent Lon protease